MTTFQAFWIEQDEETKEIKRGIRTITLEDLPPGEVLIKVHYSSVNYKDGMTLLTNNQVVTKYPMIPGIDLAGEIVSSQDQQYQAGDPVIVTSYDLGTGHFGGYAEYARVPIDWVVPLPHNLTLEEAMIYGTAGFTAALSIKRLFDEGVEPSKGPVLVTGATGGVGSLAVYMLSKLGFDVTASTGKASEESYLRKLGAKTVIERQSLSDANTRPLQKSRWQAAVDPVGGQTLANVLAQLTYNGTVAVSGLTGGVSIPTTVMPFILRGVNLVGIDSVHCPNETRLAIWNFIADQLHDPEQIKELKSVVPLSEVEHVLTEITAGTHKGRTVIKVK